MVTEIEDVAYSPLGLPIKKYRRFKLVKGKLIALPTKLPKGWSWLPKKSKGYVGDSLGHKLNRLGVKRVPTSTVKAYLKYSPRGTKVFRCSSCGSVTLDTNPRICGVCGWRK